jgi:tetratricopeptide (TPR) repeat protein
MRNLIIIFLVFPIMYLHAQEDAQKAFSAGVRLLEANQFKEAEEQFRIAIEKGEVKEGLRMSYIYMGFALNGQQKYDQAISNFTQAIEMDSTNAASFTDRGLAYAYKKDYDHAIIDFLKVLSIDSTAKQAEAAYYYLGKIKSLQFKNEEAIQYLNRLIELVPTDAEAYFLRGVAKSNMMDIDGSIADYDLAIKYRPNYMEAYANRGVQKMNKIPVSEKIGKKIKCIEEPCKDLLKAKELGDDSVNDLIFLYCKKCK